MTGQISIVAAFGAGLISFLSPCVLPLIPGYVSFLGGTTAGSGGAKRSAVVPALLFVTGFSAVFVLMGVSASLLGVALSPYRGLLATVGGVLIVIFGFLMLDVVKVPWLQREVRFDPASARGLGGWTAPVMGMAFGFGWTPCVGPILGSILTLAAGTASAAQGAVLMVVYSAGLGVPFVAAAWLLDRIEPLTRALGRHSRTISRVAGVVLMAMGLAIATGTLARVVAFLSRWAPGGVGF